MSKWPSVCMKFLKKNGEPATSTNSGRCFSAKPKVRGEQRDGRPDQRALDEAEMIVGQQMDVGDVGRQRDLVQENPDHDGDVDGKHQPPGVLPRAKAHAW